MRSSKPLLVLLVAILFALPACDSGGESEAPSITGEWSGNAVADNGVGITLDFTLIQDGSTLDGSGTATVAGGSLGMDVIGTYDYPDLNMTFTIRNPNPGEDDLITSFEGEVSESGNVLREDGDGIVFNRD